MHRMKIYKEGLASSGIFLTGNLGLLAAVARPLSAICAPILLSHLLSPAVHKLEYAWLEQWPITAVLLFWAWLHWALGDDGEALPWQWMLSWKYNATNIHGNLTWVSKLLQGLLLFLHTNSNLPMKSGWWWEYFADHSCNAPVPHSDLMVPAWEGGGGKLCSLLYCFMFPG